MTNVELINELRYCFATHKTAIPWYVWCDCAADALEAAEKRIAELNTKCADLQSHINSMESEIEELLPKEGERMTNIRWYYQQPTQTVATTDGTNFMCRSTGKLCQNATEYGYCKQTVCNVAARG